MTYYLPGYTYLFASTARQQEAPYFVRLRKEYIRAVLQDLHHVAHYAYVLLENMPENRFAIIRYHDHVRSRIDPRTVLGTDSFTLRQFFAHYDLLHGLDQFRVLFFTEVFYSEQGFTPHTLERLYRHYLKHLCTAGLRENRPLGLSEEMIREYGLTEDDTKTVGPLIRQYNADAAERLRAEYSALSALDCIK